ncbi:hypothetical protein FB645_003228 [Coemansia sp. IMI 203386]|nr:hypothetical protein FB645_003228 [Coemansia sp. IMI 203386]
MDGIVDTEMPSASAVDDFGLVDYDSPMPLEDTSMENNNNNSEQSPSVLRQDDDDLIDFEESDDEELDALVQGSGELSVSSVRFDEEEAQVIGSSSGEEEPELETELEAEPADKDEVIDLTQDALLAKEDGVPETWVYCDGHWMVYLGPGQMSYSEDMQKTLLDMPVDQLIHWLHSEIMLKDDDDLALEFPSLSLVIDQRDKECSQISLRQIYNGHVAAVDLGKISVDLVNSPYFSQTALTRQSSFIPSPETFAFIIHKRRNVHQSIQHIMQLIDEHETRHDAEDAVQQTVSDDVVVNGGGSSKGKQTEVEAEPVDDDDDDNQDEEVDGEHEQGSTADLLNQVDDDDEDDDDDEEFVADQEDAQDHVLDADAADVEEEDVVELEITEVDGDQEKAEVNAAESPASSSASNKRGQEEMSDDDHDEADSAGDDHGSEPAAKKARNEDVAESPSADAVAASASAENAVESVSA